MSSPAIALPGQVLGPATAKTTAGPSTHIHNSSLIASLAGPLTPTSSKTPSISTNRPALPAVGSEVIGTITRTQPRQAHLSIPPFSAIIRQQDIRATDIDKVVVNEAFRVGDVVRAVVISLGDERSYYASTAKNELGVVMAKSEATGNAMVPVSWREFVDLETGAREGRKVAKPV